MKHKDIQIHMKHAVLTSEEKTVFQRKLIGHMRSSQVVSSLTGYGGFWRLFRMAAAGFASVVLVGVGISYAAENALPGDTLYAMKIEVNERVRLWAALSEEAEVEWSVARTMRRLEELERLATAGDLNDTLRDQITTRLEQNTEEANKAIESLKKEQIIIAADASSRLESSLRVHERMLVQVAEDRADMSSQIHVILDTVRKKAESVSEIRQEIEKELADMENDLLIKNMVAEDKNATSTLPLQDTEEKIKELDDRKDENL